MENIFENTYFGKPYRTRGGKRALYCKESEGIHYLIVDGWCDTIAYNSDGSIWNILKNNIDDIIISEWQEEIDEKYLDELAYKELSPDCADDKEEFESCLYTVHDYLNAYKTGYRKALEK